MPSPIIISQSWTYHKCSTVSNTHSLSHHLLRVALSTPALFLLSPSTTSQIFCQIRLSLVSTCMKSVVTLHLQVYNLYLCIIIIILNIVLPRSATSLVHFSVLTNCSVLCTGHQSSIPPQTATGSQDLYSAVKKPSTLL